MTGSFSLKSFKHELTQRRKSITNFMADGQTQVFQLTDIDLKIILFSIVYFCQVCCAYSWLISDHLQYCYRPTSVLALAVQTIEFRLNRFEILVTDIGVLP